MDALDLATLIEVEAFKRYTQFAERLAERRLALFGEQRPKVTLDDLFDMEAPELAKDRSE